MSKDTIGDYWDEMQAFTESLNNPPPIAWLNSKKRK